MPLDRFTGPGGGSIDLEPSAPVDAVGSKVPSVLPKGPIASVLPLDPIKSVLGDKRSREESKVVKGKASAKAGPSSLRRDADDLLDFDEESGGGQARVEEEEEEEDYLPAHRPAAQKVKSSKKRKISKSVPSSPLAPPPAEDKDEAEPEPEPELPMKSSWDEEANIFLIEGVRKYLVRTSEDFTGMAWAKIASEGKGILPTSSRVSSNAACKDRWRTIVKNVEKDFVGCRDKSFTDTVKQLAKEVHDEEKKGLEHDDPEEEGEEEEE